MSTIKEKEITEAPDLISLSRTYRILFTFACGILVLENLILVISNLNRMSVEGVIFILDFPIDILAFLILGLGLLLEFHQKRKTCNIFFLYTGLLLLCWSILTLIWRSMVNIPSEINNWLDLSGTVGSSSEYIFIAPLFVLAATCLTIALRMLIYTLNHKTKEGQTFQQNHRRIKSLFHFIAYLYLIIHWLSSIFVLIIYLPLTFNSNILGVAAIASFFGKILLVPLIGIFFYFFLAALYIGQKISNT